MGAEDDAEEEGNGQRFKFTHVQSRVENSYSDRVKKRQTFASINIFAV